MSEPDDPTRIVRRPTEPVPPTPAYGAVTFGQVALEGGVLCVECRACAKRTALTKQECPPIRTGNSAFVLHATFKCSRVRIDRRAALPSDQGRSDDVSRG